MIQDTREKIAILGASGFVGASLCERMYFQGGYNFTALVGSTGNAGRLARFPIDIQQVNLLDTNMVAERIKGCHCVVNCARGEGAVMKKGLKNLILALKMSNVPKIIHIGSMAIYGNNPEANAQTELGIPNPGNDAYGKIKLWQDQKILSLNSQGIKSLVLCPSNISGPYSPYILGAINALQERNVVMVDGGKNPTNLVHVHNLVEGILSIIKSDSGWGERFFINDAEQTSWKEFFTDLSNALGLPPKFLSVSREDILQQLVPTKKKAGVMSTIKTLMSGEFRNAFSVVPFFQKANMFLYETFNSLNPSIQNWVRDRFEKPIILSLKTQGPILTKPCNTVQLRRYYHSPQKLESATGYKPVLNYKEGTQKTFEWLKFAGKI